MAKVLVTGAGGFIGSHLTEELVRQGGEVRALVRYNSRDERGLLEEVPRDILEQVEVVPGDLKDGDGEPLQCLSGMGACGQDRPHLHE